MRIAVLGPTQAWLGEGDERPVDLRTQKQRAMLAALALYPNRPVSSDRLLDLVWGEAPPRSTSATLHSYIARLRRDLEPDRAPRAASTRLATTHGGYQLAVPRDGLDVAVFEDVVVEVRSALLETPAPPADVAERLADRLDAVLATWRGAPYADLEGAADAEAERARLEELRLVALEDRATIALARGHHATAAADLEALVAAHPLRERLWGLRATALAGSGRQADALAALEDVRVLLDEQLGLEPGPELRRLQTAILRQDPEVRAPRPTTDPTPLPARASVRARRGTVAPTWPFVGRDRDRDSLLALVAQVADGQPAAAVLTGDAGAGTSRLCAEVVAAAETAGLQVLSARCAVVDGAPPLRPWAEVLASLGLDLPVGTADVGAQDLQRDVETDGTEVGPGVGTSLGRFEAWEQIARAVLDAAATPTLLLLEDLHGADPSSLRVLRLIVEEAGPRPLLVLGTWRTHPAPSGPLAEAAEALARRHALRVDLGGLDAADTAMLAHAITGEPLTREQSHVLHARTDGHPFFVVEFCRLAVNQSSLDALLSATDPPSGVGDVVERRLASLSAGTRRTLQGAAVAGRSFDLDQLVAALDRDEDELLDELDEAIAAGVIREDDVDRFGFTHSLTRDTIYTGLTQSRRARQHARSALALEGRPDRESEVARHWLAAGERHAARAWRAALEAASWAGRLYAYDEAAALLEAAADSVLLDPAATTTDRYDVHLALARALQEAGSWAGLRPVIHQALGLALTTGDVDRVVEVTTLPLTGALWQAAGHGFVDDVVVEALRGVLVRLPEDDSIARCRVLLSLAGELYYSPGSAPAERETLVDEAVAMARRLGDDELLCWACITGSTATWRAATAPERLTRLDEAVVLARDLGGDGQVLSSALALRASALSELGRVDRLRDALAEARAEADRRRHLFALLVVGTVEVGWAAMRGDDDVVDALVEEVAVTEGRIGMFGDSTAALTAIGAVWRRDDDALLQATALIEAHSPLPTWYFCAAMRGRAGRPDLVGPSLAGADFSTTGDAWFSPMSWAMAAEVSLTVDDPDLARSATRAMRGLSGTTANTGSLSLGPIDAFQAMAAAAAGDRTGATAHADEAERWCVEWDIPRALHWVREVRAAHDF